MNSKLLALLMVSGSAVVLGGVVYVLARPGPGATRAELADAGVTVNATLECEGRVTCDGYSGRRIRTAYIPAYVGDLEDGGRLLVPLLGRRIRNCFELRGSVEEACELVTDGGQADQDDDAPVRAVGDRCWCRARDGGACRWAGNPVDGGPLMMDFGNVHRGPVVGPACRRAACGVFFLVDAGRVDDEALHGDCL